jgi:hypothetical protein
LTRQPGKEFLIVRKQRNHAAILCFGKNLAIIASRV